MSLCATSRLQRTFTALFYSVVLQHSRTTLFYCALLSLLTLLGLYGCQSARIVLLALFGFALVESVKKLAHSLSLRIFSACQRGLVKLGIVTRVSDRRRHEGEMRRFNECELGRQRDEKVVGGMSNEARPHVERISNECRTDLERISNERRPNLGWQREQRSKSCARNFHTSRPVDLLALRACKIAVRSLRSFFLESFFPWITLSHSFTAPRGDNAPIGT